MPKVLVVTNVDDIPTKAIDGKPTLVYWNILCLAQCIRLALVDAGVDFVDVRIEAGPPDENYRKGWKLAKQSIALRQVLTFPNLPYLFHPDLGDQGLVQSDSILRFIGKTYGRMGKEPALTDMYIEHMYDFDMEFTNIAYDLGPEATLTWLKNKLPMILKSMEKVIAENHYLSGQADPSMADWKWYVFLYKMKMIHEQLGDESTGSILRGNKNWVASYMQRMESIPSVKQYMESSSYMRHYLHSPHAKWRG